MKAIETIEDIKLLVDTFYGKVREDELLADVFNQVIVNNWDKHLDKMYRFWQTVLLGQQAYKGHPFLPHIHLAIDHTHFQRWISLFHETLEEHFHGKKAEEAKWRTIKMAEMFQQKIAHYRNSSAIPIK